MRRFCIPLVLMLFSLSPMWSQSITLGLEARGGYIFDGTPDFFADNVTFVANGSIDDRFFFNWSQRLTRPFVGPQPLNGSDVLYLAYTSGHWSFSAGKQFLECGGLEYDASPIDLHYTTECYDKLNCYVLGVSAARSFGDFTAVAQFARSPFATLDTPEMNSLKAFSVSLHRLYDRFWVPHYSLNLFETSPHEYSFQFTLGNRFEITRWLAFEWDFINRSKPRSANLFRDYSMVCYSSIRPADWLEIMFKATYDYNELWDDPLVARGTDLWKIGTGAYFFPTSDRRSVRLHYYLYRNGRSTFFQLGLTIKPTLLNLDFK